MFIELSMLPLDIQQSIMQNKQPVDIMNNGLLIATIMPNHQQNIVTNNAYDYFCSFDYPEHISDIEFELAKHNQLNEKDVNFD